MTTVNDAEIQRLKKRVPSINEADNPPYKGILVNLLLDDEQWHVVRDEASRLPDYVMNDRQTCDCELLLNGGFSPLRGFMNQEDYEGVVNNMRMSDGTLWPMPITLDVTQAQAEQWKVGDRIALRDQEMNLIAVLNINSIYVPDKSLEAEKVFGSPDDMCHPAIAYLFEKAGSHYVGGTLQGFQLPVHYDFTELRLSPIQTRQRFRDLSFQRIVGFQTRNPMHRSHRELTLLAARDAKANVLIHPVVGMTKPGDVDHYTRVRVYMEVMNYYPKGMAMLALLPLAMRMAGPREAVWHAIIRKNYGCTHFIVGRDHAGPGNNRDGKPFYDPYAAQEMLFQHMKEIGIEVVAYQQVVWVEDLAEYRTIDNIPNGCQPKDISGTELRRRLYKGLDIPEWFSFPEVVRILRQTYPPPSHQGFTVFFTGLSGSGKSTIANALRVALLEDGRKTVTLLDGDEVRQHLSTELGFSKEHRELNIRRISYVASEITKARGVAICSAIAPYRAPREFSRSLISKYGGFFEVYVSTPLDVCESRDRKGLYSKARQGIIKGFTGVDDPYEVPSAPELVIDTSEVTVRQAVHQIILMLEQEGFFGSKVPTYQQ